MNQQVKQSNAKTREPNGFTTAVPCRMFRVLGLSGENVLGLHPEARRRDAHRREDYLMASGMDPRGLFRLCPLHQGQDP